MMAPPSITQLRNPDEIIRAIANRTHVIKAFTEGQACGMGRVALACCQVGELPDDIVTKVWEAYPFFGAMLERAQQRFKNDPDQPSQLTLWPM